eukprot:Phypoly_transcript_09440.p1 GENE.Phypoly_transcript_09440~~Phypoly_transcript_09440.p1  ORF type:complete len:400 (+),score=88.45 Phypoly_transcript_09440:153-1352(+)
MPAVRVAIIGAGPAGLTLARLLQHNNSNNNFAVSVYEREESRDTRQQGGTLDLHPKAGLLALEHAGLMDQFRAKARPEGQDLRILDKNDQVHLDYVAEEEKINHPEIDRTILRDILLDSLLPNTIKWGHKLLSVTSSGPTYKLQFDGGKEAEADLVVGAEGAWSKVRNLLTDTKPIYTGITMVEIRISDIDARFPELGKFVGRGSVFLFSHGKSIQIQRNSTGAVRGYVGMSVPETWVAQSGIDFDKPEEVRARLLELFSDWTSKSLDFIRNCDDDFMIPRPLYALPVPPAGDEAKEKEGKWPKHHEGVTLIGDSAHVTGPSGKGVNYAMLDALELAKGLIGIGKEHNAQEIARVLTEYQKGLFPRTREAIVSGEKVMAMKYAPDAPIPFATYVKKAHS